MHMVELMVKSQRISTWIKSSCSSVLTAYLFQSLKNNVRANSFWIWIEIKPTNISNNHPLWIWHLILNYSKVLRCTFLGEWKNSCSSKFVQLELIIKTKARASKTVSLRFVHLKFFFDPIQKRALSRSVQLKSVYLEVLLPVIPMKCHSWLLSPRAD